MLIFIVKPFFFDKVVIRTFQLSFNICFKIYELHCFFLIALFIEHPLSFLCYYSCQFLIYQNFHLHLNLKKFLKLLIITVNISFYLKVYIHDTLTTNLLVFRDSKNFELKIPWTWNLSTSNCNVPRKDKRKN